MEPSPVMRVLINNGGSRGRAVVLRNEFLERRAQKKKKNKGRDVRDLEWSAYLIEAARASGEAK